MEKAQLVYQDAAIIIHRLAGTIDEEDLSEGYLTAIPVQAVLEMSAEI